MQSVLRIKLIHVFWAMSLVAASLARFGVWGIAVALGVFIFWLVIGLAASGRCSWFQVLFGFIAFFLGATLLLPVFGVWGHGHGPSPESRCSNNLRQIQLAILNYEASNNCFPPPYIAADSGKPAHSWRVLILPYMECEELYERYDFDEPWDSPSNLKLLNEMPDTFACPSRDDGLCHYQAVTGDDSAWRVENPVRISELKRGMSKCVIVTETIQGVPWTKPVDLTPVEFMKAAKEQAHDDKRGGHLCGTELMITGQRLRVAYADGHISTIEVPQQAHWLEQLARRTGEVDSKTLDSRHFEPKMKQIQGATVAGWLFIALGLLPIGTLARNWSKSRKQNLLS